jgi:hypothetical protein
MVATSKGSEYESYPRYSWSRISAREHRLRAAGSCPTCGAIRSNSTRATSQTQPYSGMGQSQTQPYQATTYAATNQVQTQPYTGMGQTQTQPSGMTTQTPPSSMPNQPRPYRASTQTQGQLPQGSCASSCKDARTGRSDPDRILSETRRYLADLGAQNSAVHWRHSERQRQSYLRRGRPVQRVNAANEPNTAARLLAINTDPKLRSSNRGFGVVVGG